ncbi:hypothetical protein Dimus_015189, partial [Dionaea muscipula]
HEEDKLKERNSEKEEEEKVEEEMSEKNDETEKSYGTEEAKEMEVENIGEAVEEVPKDDTHEKVSRGENQEEKVADDAEQEEYANKDEIGNEDFDEIVDKDDVVDEDDDARTQPTYDGTRSK